MTSAHTFHICPSYMWDHGFSSVWSCGSSLDETKQKPKAGHVYQSCLSDVNVFVTGNSQVQSHERDLIVYNHSAELIT